MDLEELTASLRRNNYCLMTNDHGVEVYDEKGNLLVCKADSGDCMPIPNIDVLRKLYDLPIQKAGTQDGRKLEILQLNNESENSTFILEGEDAKDNPVWVGLRTERCRAASKVLIELFDSIKYRKLMSDRTTVKLKVWEKIAADIQARGFKIATTSREAGLRTFQKWRNMERTYWKFLKNPDEWGEDKRRKKPWYYDDLHAILIRRKKYLKLYNSLGLTSLIQNLREDEKMEEELDDASMNQNLNGNEEIEYMLESDEGDTSIPLGQISNSEMRGARHEDMTVEAVEALLKLMASDEYQELFREGGRKSKVWEKIYDNMERMGFSIPGDSRQNKGQRLCQKWRNLKRYFLKYQLGRQNFSNIDKKKKPQFYDLTLKVITKEMFINHSEMFLDEDNIMEAIDPVGFLENTHVDHNYERIDCIRRSTKDGSSIINNAVTNVPIPRTPQITTSNQTNTATTSSKILPVLSESLADSVSLPVVMPLPTATPPTVSTTTNQSSLKSSKILLDIKAVLESGLSLQQQNFSKVISLLEEQVEQQRTLNSLFTQYVTNQSKKKKSDTNLKNKDNTEESKL